MRIILLGTGEAFDENWANTSALVHAESTILLDCGYSIPAAVWAYGGSADLLDAIYITHAHADHYFGVPPLLVRMYEDKRTRPLTIISQKDVLDRVWALMELAYPGTRDRLRFPMERVEVSADRELEWREFRLRFAPSRHSISNLAIRIEHGGKAFCYSGDGMFTDAGRELFANADVLLHEAYSFDASPAHADIPRLIEMAEQCGVKRLVLAHIRRDLRKDEARLGALSSGTALRVARPGDEFVLG
ncbi:MAG TPA: ribonuclease Z [Bryobacteraceae bacterium]|nr:ribonuclease Z [Bryobacteraceae bacterium]